MRNIKFKGKCLNPKPGKDIACGSLLTFPDGSARIFEHDHAKVFNYFSVTTPRAAITSPSVAARTRKPFTISHSWQVFAFRVT